MPVLSPTTGKSFLLVTFLSLLLWTTKTYYWTIRKLMYCWFSVLCPGLHEMLALLTSQLHPGANHKEDLVFLREVFSERSLGYLMRVCIVSYFACPWVCVYVCLPWPPNSCFAIDSWAPQAVWRAESDACAPQCCLPGRGCKCVIFSSAFLE